MIDVVLREVRRIPTGEAVVQQGIPGYPDGFGPPINASIDPDTVYAEWWAAQPVGIRLLVKVNGREYQIRKSDNRSGVVNALTRLFVPFKFERRGPRVFAPAVRAKANPDDWRDLVENSDSMERFPDAEDAVRRALAAGATPPLRYSGTGMTAHVLRDARGLAFKVGRAVLHSPEEGTFVRSVSPTVRRMLAEEAAWLKTAGRGRATRDMVPRLHRWDAENAVIVRDHVPGLLAFGRHPKTGQYMDEIAREKFKALEGPMLRRGWTVPEEKPESWAFDEEDPTKARLFDAGMASMVGRRLVAHALRLIRDRASREELDDAMRLIRNEATHWKSPTIRIQDARKVLDALVRAGGDPQLARDMIGEGRQGNPRGDRFVLGPYWDRLFKKIHGQGKILLYRHDNGADERVTWDVLMQDVNFWTKHADPKMFRVVKKNPRPRVRLRRPPRVNPAPYWVQDAWQHVGRAPHREWEPARDAKGLIEDQLGCGLMGCVIPTRDPRIVVKVTADQSEVALVEALLQMPDPPWEGLVRYYAIRATGKTRIIPPSRPKKRPGQLFTPTTPRIPTSVLVRDRSFPTYAMWREAAIHVGLEKLPSRPANLGPAPSLVPPSTGLARKVLEAEYRKDRERAAASGWGNVVVPFDEWYAHRAGVAERAHREHWIASGRRYFDDAEREQIRAAKALLFQYYDYARQIAQGSRSEVTINLARNAARRLAAGGPLRHVGSSLERLLLMGILLDDLHGDNLGIVLREDGERWVVTDPGKAVFL